MAGDFFEDLVSRCGWAPVPEGLGFTGIQDHPGDVEGAVFGFGDNFMVAKAFIAPSRELAEGHRGFCSPREINDSIGRSELLRGKDLVQNQGGQIARVQAVADLVTFPIEADVAERPAAEMAVDPVGEDTLVGTTELSSSGHDAATVDESREAKCFTEFQRKHFAGEFAGAVEGDWRLGGKRFADAEGGDARGMES